VRTHLNTVNTTRVFVREHTTIDWFKFYFNIVHWNSDLQSWHLLSESHLLWTTNKVKQIQYVTLQQKENDQS